MKKVLIDLKKFELQFLVQFDIMGSLIYSLHFIIRGLLFKFVRSSHDFVISKNVSPFKMLNIALRIYIPTDSEILSILYAIILNIYANYIFYCFHSVFL